MHIKCMGLYRNLAKVEGGIEDSENKQKKEKTLELDLSSCYVPCVHKSQAGR